MRVKQVWIICNQCSDRRQRRINWPNNYCGCLARAQHFLIRRAGAEADITFSGIRKRCHTMDGDRRITDQFASEQSGQFSQTSGQDKSPYRLFEQSDVRVSCECDTAINAVSCRLRYSRALVASCLEIRFHGSKNVFCNVNGGTRIQNAVANYEVVTCALRKLLNFFQH